MKGKVLVLSPHADDGELGCGGTIAKLVERGEEIYYLALSAAGKSVPEGFPKDALRHEVRNAMKVLGVQKSHVLVKNFETREFPRNRQAILDLLIDVRNKVNPSIILTPSQTDIHQDHQVTTQEALRAFKNTASTILGYEQPWNNLSFTTTLFVVLQQKHVLSKSKALNKYHSQRKRKYLNPLFVLSLAVTRGVSIGEEYAEAFEVIRWVDH